MLKCTLSLSCLGHWLDVLFCEDAPEIVVAPLNTTTIEGRSAVLFCNATGSPKPNVTWSKGGSNTTLSSFEELILDNLTRSHCGTKYKCIITNYLGSVEASARVTVYCKYKYTYSKEIMLSSSSSYFVFLKAGKFFPLRSFCGCIQSIESNSLGRNQRDSPL